MSDLETRLREGLADAARTVPAGEAIPPTLRSQVVRRRRRRGALMAALTSVLLVGGGALAVRELRATEGTTVVAGPGPSVGPGADGRPVPLVDTTWELVDLRSNGAPLPPEIPGDQRPNLRLGADGKATWYDGCNDGGGEYELRDGRLARGAHGFTVRGCENETTPSLFAAVLGGDPVASVDGTTLTLTADNGDALVFSAVIDPVGKPAPAVTYTASDGSVRNLTNPGQWVVVALDATWCVPCRIQRTELAQLAADKPSVQILTVPYSDDPARVRDDLASQGLGWPVVTIDGSTLEQMGVRGIPYSFVVDPEGRVVAVIDGDGDLSSIESILP